MDFNDWWIRYGNDLVELKDGETLACTAFYAGISVGLNMQPEPDPNFIPPIWEGKCVAGGTYERG